MTSQPETRSRRGGLLTALAILFALVVVVDLLKAFTMPQPDVASKTPPIGIVFLGVRHTGTSATILGLIMAAILFFYAGGIWRMKRYALAISWIYAAYVILNVSLFTIRNPQPTTPDAILFAVLYMASVVLVTLAAAIALTRRRHELS
jgi:thiamine transporter ThiT